MPPLLTDLCIKCVFSGYIVAFLHVMVPPECICLLPFEIFPRTWILQYNYGNQTMKICYLPYLAKSKSKFFSGDISSTSGSFNRSFFLSLSEQPRESRGPGPRSLVSEAPVSEENRTFSGSKN